jgi:hypothetical protein
MPCLRLGVLAFDLFLLGFSPNLIGDKRMPAVFDPLAFWLLEVYVLWMPNIFTSLRCQFPRGLYYLPPAPTPGNRHNIARG